MCRHHGRSVGVLLVVGVALALLGLVQLSAVIYFMLALPIFQLGSNLWTGSWSLLCGAAVGKLGHTGQVDQHSNLVLGAVITVLVTNVANLVLVQVGEAGTFLSENDRATITLHQLQLQLDVAIWLTTAATALSILVSFLAAQYLLCVVIRGPKVKGRLQVTRSLSEEDLHHRQVAASKAPPRTTPTLHASSAVGFYGECDSPQTGAGLACFRDAVHVDGKGGYDNHALESSDTVTPAATTAGASTQTTAEGDVPYFLLNHPHSWKFIFPSVLQEMRETFSPILEEPSEPSSSRGSSLSRSSYGRIFSFPADSSQFHTSSGEHDNQAMVVEEEERYQPLPISTSDSLILDPRRLSLTSPRWSSNYSYGSNNSIYSFPESSRSVPAQNGHRLTRPKTRPPPLPTYDPPDIPLTHSTSRISSQYDVPSIQYSESSLSQSSSVSTFKPFQNSTDTHQPSSLRTQHPTLNAPTRHYHEPINISSRNPRNSFTPSHVNPRDSFTPSHVNPRESFTPSHVNPRDSFTPSHVNPRDSLTLSNSSRRDSFTPLYCTPFPELSSLSSWTRYSSSKYATPNTTASGSSLTGWDSCAVTQFAIHSGGGYVIDLD